MASKMSKMMKIHSSAIEFVHKMNEDAMLPHNFVIY